MRNPRLNEAISRLTTFRSLSITNSTFAVTDVSGLGECGMAGVPFLGTEFVEPVFAFFLDNLFDGKLTMVSLPGSFFVGDHQLLAC